MESDANTLLEKEAAIDSINKKNRVLRREDYRMVAGKGTYTEDITPSNTLYAVFLRSEHAHARIKRINTDKAETSRGVVAIYTGMHLKDHIKPVPTLWNLTNANFKATKYYAVAFDKVRYAGDPVAVVVATSRYMAEDAVNLIEVDYEDLQAVTDQEASIKDISPRIYDEIDNNIALTWKMRDPNIEQVFDSADIIIKERIVNQRLQPTAMETRGVVAKYDRYTGETTIWMTSQNPHLHRYIIADMLGIPEQRLRVISPDVGGAFGSKISCYGNEAVLAYISKDLDRPIKWQETRYENFVSTTHGRGHVQYVELAAKRDGTILGLKVKVLANLGAWLSTTAPGIPTILFAPMLSGQYNIKAVDCEVVGVLTNTMAVDAYRGAGRPEASFLVERMVDILAHKLGIDPADIRFKNYIKSDDFPHPVVTGMLYDSGDYKASLEKALKIIDYYKLRQKQKDERKIGKLTGIGIASYIEVSGVGPSRMVRSTGFEFGLWESATVRVHPSGKITVFTGGNPHGQGEETTFAQLVSNELNVPMENVDIIHGDTQSVAFGMGTYGSRTTPVAGGAIALACRKLIIKGIEIAAFIMDKKNNEISYKNGSFVFTSDNNNNGIPFEEIARSAYGSGPKELPSGMEPGFESTVFYDPENFVFPYGTHICQVEIDPETFEVKIKRYIAVDDCGTQINPMLVEGQVHGGVAQGIGQALYEESIYDSIGNLLTSDLSSYAIPGPLEVPKIETYFTVTPSPHNPIGAKGIGESGTIAAPTAVVNAVIDALWHLGITNLDMPLKPETIWRSVKENLKTR